jgi:hypothetical protein
MEYLPNFRRQMPMGSEKAVWMCRNRGFSFLLLKLFFH